MAKAATPRARGADLRKERERELISVTRRLFDERGVQEAPIEVIAREAGIARGLIYREFSSKEELFVVTVSDYLRELGQELESARDAGGTPTEQLERGARVYCGFCARYPAFLDCALSLMKQPLDGLLEVISEARYLRLGRGMSRCVATVAVTLREGKETGEFEIEDPDYLANLLWTQVLGAMHLARLGVGVKMPSPGIPEVFPIEADQVIESMVSGAMALARPRSA